MMDTLGEEAPELVLEPVLYHSSDLIIIGKSPSLQSFLEWVEDVVVTWREKSLHHPDTNLRLMHYVPYTFCIRYDSLH
ncbi:hypothetical protein TNCV_4673121 [Trichonephila clavipes]|nr:hypothetical protein TNCV_4673121 [Trichonephila clavipes]